MPISIIPAFGAAVIGRLLEHRGLRVAVCHNPIGVSDLRDFKKLGKLSSLLHVSAGAMDSMINHYTVNKRSAL